MKAIFTNLPLPIFYLYRQSCVTFDRSPIHRAFFPKKKKSKIKCYIKLPQTVRAATKINKSGVCVAFSATVLKYFDISY